MQHWNEQVSAYLTDHTRINDPLLLEMEKRGAKENFPIIGPQVGPWLYFFAKLTNAKHIYELGSGFGYSTWYFAKAVKENGGGTVTHTVWDADLSKEARVWLDRAGLLPQCQFIVSEAVLALTEAKPGLDLIFMDIDKEGYVGAVEVIEKKLRPGGLLLTDNVIWSGKVCEEADTSASTVAIRQFNDLMRDSKRWQYVINPLRDGLGVALFQG